MFCDHCGNRIDEDSSFCSICGKKVTPFESTLHGDTNIISINNNKQAAQISTNKENNEGVTKNTVSVPQKNNIQISKPKEDIKEFMICDNCGNLISKDSIVCIFCGKRTTPDESALQDDDMYEMEEIEDIQEINIQEDKGNKVLCERCGNFTDIDNIFCDVCGEKRTLEKISNDLICENCGQPIDENNAFCAYCGWKRTVKLTTFNSDNHEINGFCGYCGKPMREGDAFCRICGKGKGLEVETGTNINRGHKSNKMLIFVILLLIIIAGGFILWQLYNERILEIINNFRNPFEISEVAQKTDEIYATDEITGKDNTTDLANTTVIDTSKTIETITSNNTTTNDLLTTMTKEEHTALHTFFSNFSEANLNSFDFNRIDVNQVMNFALMHDYMNNFSLYSITNGGFLVIPSDDVAQQIDRYLGITGISFIKYSDDINNFNVYDNNFYFYMDNGAPYLQDEHFHFNGKPLRWSQVTSFSANEDGTYTAYLDVYESLNPPENLYEDIGDWQTVPGAQIDKIMSCKAIVKPINYNGKHTYQLVQLAEAN